MRFIKRCKHPDAAVKCHYKEWAWSAAKGKAVRLCFYSGVCVCKEEEGGEVKNGEGQGGERPLH
jgi:hypothetical protein